MRSKRRDSACRRLADKIVQRQDQVQVIARAAAILHALEDEAAA